MVFLRLGVYVLVRGVRVRGIRWCDERYVMLRVANDFIIIFDESWVLIFPYVFVSIFSDQSAKREDGWSVG